MGGSDGQFVTGQRNPNWGGCPREAGCMSVYRGSGASRPVTDEDPGDSAKEDEVFVPVFTNQHAVNESERGSPDDGGTLRPNEWCRDRLPFAVERECHLEHIAGPGCINTYGYSGHRISIEEMRTCTTVQCLVPKKTCRLVDRSARRRRV